MNKYALNGMLGLWLGLCNATNARAQDVPPPPPQEEVAQKGVEVLTRGPIHEAFAEPLTLNARPNPIIHQKPPAPIEELPPDERPDGNNIQWIPGYFAWDETGNDFIWISGVWRALPPGKQWMPGHWNAEGDGWQWISGYWGAEGQTDVDYLPPPPTSLDVGPSADAPDADSLYTPGTWVYQERRYLWRPGFWLKARADWFYNPARYTCTPAGYIFCDGYWDYPLERRGVLFAPARFAADVWGIAGWNYQPRFALGYQGLLSSFFVRPDFNRYYFGDYYEPQFGRLGFVPWFDHRMGVKTLDPLFGYARWNARADAKWEGDLRTLNRERFAGTVARPPITLIKQNEFIHNVTVNKKVLIGDKLVAVADPQSVLRHMAVVAPMNKIEHKEFKFVPVAKAAAVEERKAAQRFTAAAVERQQREVKVISQGHPTKPADAPVRIKVEQPRVVAPARVVHVATPVAPVVPKHVERPIPVHEPIKPIHVNPPAHKEKEKAKGKSASLQNEGKFHALVDRAFVSDGQLSRICQVAADTEYVRRRPDAACC